MRCTLDGPTEVAGRRLQLAVRARLRGAEAALLVRVFAEERHVLSVRDHRVGDVRRPPLGAVNHHAASLGRDEAAGWQEQTFVTHFGGPPAIPYV